MGGKLRSNWVQAFAVVALLAAHGCGDSGGAKPAPLDTPEDEPRMDGGITRPADAGRRDASVDAGAALGPLIEVLTPQATDDPANENVVSGATLTVRCSIAKNPKGEAVDPKTTKVSLYSGDDTKAIVTQVAVSTADENVFQAENINLVDVPHGALRVECSGSDVATKVQSSSVSITALYDAGPKISFVNPREKGFVSVGDGKLGTDVIVRFKVEPQPLSDDDPGAEISEIKAFVGGRLIENVEASTQEENTYLFPIDFSDTGLFTAIPKTLSLRVEATNRRQPKARSTNASLTVGVDADGPTITVKNPVRVNGQDPVISGKVDVVLEVKDALAGVNATSVEIRVEKLGGGKDTYPASAQNAAGDMFLASFETGSYPGLPSLNVTLVARDNVGIETTSNLSLDIDTVAPWLSFDTPTVREVFEKTTHNDCTGPFDPLGDAVTEGTVSGLAFVPRVLIWDRPLRLPNDQIVTRYAMIDNSTTRLYIQHNASVPLLVDSDNDANNECDAINNNSEDTTRAPVPLVLASVKPAGQGPLAGTDTTSDPSAADPPYNCNISITGMAPPPLAADTSLTRIIKHTATGGDPVVYADSPTTSGLRVAGKAYVSTRTGWACLVAVAKDNAGNFGFTPPMRVCIDGATGACASAGPMPSCTDGCNIPARFQAGASDGMPRILYYRR